MQKLLTTTAKWKNEKEWKGKSENQQQKPKLYYFVQRRKLWVMHVMSNEILLDVFVTPYLSLYALYCVYLENCFRWQWRAAFVQLQTHTHTDPHLTIRHAGHKQPLKYSTWSWSCTICININAPSRIYYSDEIEYKAEHNMECYTPPSILPSLFLPLSLSHSVSLSLRYALCARMLHCWRAAHNSHVSSTSQVILESSKNLTINSFTDH